MELNNAVKGTGQVQAIKNYKGAPVSTGRLRLRREQLAGLIVVYRWLALLLPGASLLLNSANQGYSLVVIGLAVANAAGQTAGYFKLRSLISKNLVYDPANPQPGQRLALMLIVIELLVCCLSNSLSDSLFYLYSLTPLLSSALWTGASGTFASASILMASYLAARVSTFLVGGGTLNGPVIVTNLAGFFLVALLAGYLLRTWDQLRSYATIIGRYRGNLERQNQSLEQTNQQLEYISDFNRVIQGGNTPAEVEQLAVLYINRLLTSQRIRTAAQSGPPIQLLQNEALQDWLQVAQNRPEVEAQPARRGIIEVVKENQLYWLVPLTYKGDQYGALLVTGVPDTPIAIELEEKLLVSLLAQQLANILGTLKQTQALAVEAERTRLAMDMHDVVAQSLFGIAYNLDACLKLLDKDPAASRQRLGDLRTLAFDTLGSVRSIIYDLSSEETGDIDFANFLQAFIKKAAPLYPFKLSLKIEAAPGTDFRLDHENQKNLYRVVQEALSNVAKHAVASLVELRMVRTRQGLHLEISDNGRGFQARPEGDNGPVAFGGMGLQNMQERAQAAGANLKVDSQPGKGTKVLIDLPLSH